MNDTMIADGNHFWGHAGLEFSGDPKKRWVPISAAEACRLERILSAPSRLPGWLAMETLNNRMLLLNPTQWRCISLLDDGEDWPEGNVVAYSGVDGYAGMPAEVYRQMAAWNGNGNFNQNPTAMQSEALIAIERGGFVDRRDELQSFLRYTEIHFQNGNISKYEADQLDLYKLMEIEDDVDIGSVKISEKDGVTHFYSIDSLSMIDVPIIELDAAREKVAADSDL